MFAVMPQQGNAEGKTKPAFETPVLKTCKEERF
jgi:hypothetical protein